MRGQRPHRRASQFMLADDAASGNCVVVAHQLLR
jgi:hypothetical protein